MAVSLTVAGEALIPGKPRVRVEKLGGGIHCDLASDGRILHMVPVDASKAPPPEHTAVFLQNFFDEVRRRVNQLIHRLDFQHHSIRSRPARCALGGDVDVSIRTQHDVADPLTKVAEQHFAAFGL